MVLHHGISQVRRYAGKLAVHVRGLLQSKQVNLSDHQRSFGNLNHLPHSPERTGDTAVMAGFDYDVESGFGAAGGEKGSLGGMHHSMLWSLVFSRAHRNPAPFVKRHKLR